MTTISLVIEQKFENLHLGDVLIEGGKDGAVTPEIPLVKQYNDYTNSFVTKWEMYDYQAFCGLVEVYNDGDVRLYLIDSNTIYEAYRNGNCLVYLVELDNSEEYNIFLKSVK